MLKYKQFEVIETLLPKIKQRGYQSHDQIEKKFNTLYFDIITMKKFPVNTMILYQTHLLDLNRIESLKFEERITDFFNTDLLENRFSDDPSDFGIVLALALKNLHLGNIAKAKQLFVRVANSKYREATLANSYLVKFTGNF
jgi:hypothetical protein